jgi:general secretion pathway protein C
MKTVEDRFLEGFGSYTHALLQATVRNPTRNARLALIAKLVLVALIALSAAKMTWQIFSLTQTQEPLKPLGTTTSRPGQPPAGGFSKVADLHLFGEAAPEKVLVAAPIKAPETRLQLVLNGIFSSDTPAISMAIIAEKGKKDVTYFKGDTVPGNARLHEIYADRVILSRAGKFETLSLKRPEAKIERVSDDAAQSVTLPVTTAADSDKSPENIEQLQEIRQQLRTNPQELFDKLRLTPIEAPGSGGLLGYRLEYADGTLLKKLGLQAQDIVTSINGIPVTNTEPLMELMENPASMKVLNFSILRDGMPQSLTVQLD